VRQKIRAQAKGCQPFKGWQPLNPEKVGNPGKIRQHKLMRMALQLSNHQQHRWEQ